MALLEVALSAIAVAASPTVGGREPAAKTCSVVELGICYAFAIEVTAARVSS